MTETPHIEDEQQRLAEMLRSFDAPAPESLHRRIESLVASHQSQFTPRSPRRRLRPFSPFGLASAGAVAAAIVAVAIAVGLGGGGSFPTVSFSQQPRQPCVRRRSPRRQRARRTMRSLPSRSMACRSLIGVSASAGAAADRAPIALRAARSRRSSMPTRAANGSAMRSSPAPQRRGWDVA